MKKDNPWFIYAREDYETLNLIADSPLYRVRCFHSQQLAEKIIKAALYEDGIRIPRTHNITYLLSLFDFEIPLYKNDMEFLSTIYIESRYPPDIGLLPGGEPTETDALRAEKAAKQIYDFFVNR